MYKYFKISAFGFLENQEWSEITENEFNNLVEEERKVWKLPFAHHLLQTMPLLRKEKIDDSGAT